MVQTVIALLRKDFMREKQNDALHTLAFATVILALRVVYCLEDGTDRRRKN
ncbi:MULTISPECIES: hypothetical protein [unclassified Bradyrhizobium]|uniref:hypothetical protein n=1 Tax=unclassified Bradyrhizobium TaxID=2631580 RepID=UPI00339645A5